MKPLFVLALLVSLVGIALAVPINVVRPVRDPRKMGATVAGSGLDASIAWVHTMPDGSATIQLSYKNASGKIFHTRSLTVPANRATPIIDSNGTQVSATVPGALGTAIDSFNTNLQSLLVSAATAGKLDL